MTSSGHNDDQHQTQHLYDLYEYGASHTPRARARARERVREREGGIEIKHNKAENAAKSKQNQRGRDRDTERVRDATASKLADEIFNICSKDVDSAVAQVLSKRDQKAADATLILTI